MRVAAIAIFLALAGCVQSDPLPPADSGAPATPSEPAPPTEPTPASPDRGASPPPPPSTQTQEGKASIQAGALGHGGAGSEQTYMSATLPSGFAAATIVATWTAKTPASESLELVLCECKKDVQPLASAKGKSPLTLDVPKDVAPGDYRIGIFADTLAVQQEAGIVLTITLGP